MPPKRLIVPALLSTFLALPLGGFVFGFMNCGDCGANVFGRALVGLVFAVLTPLTGGFPPKNEGGVGAPFNAWPHIAITWLALFSFLAYRAKRSDGKTAKDQLPDPRK